MSWSFIQHATNHLSKPRFGEQKQPTLWPSGATAIIEGRFTDAADALRNRHARQAGAPRESLLPDAGDTLTNHDARQALATTEGPYPDAGNTIRNHDAL